MLQKAEGKRRFQRTDYQLSPLESASFLLLKMDRFLQHKFRQTGEKRLLSNLIRAQTNVIGSIFHPSLFSLGSISFHCKTETYYPNRSDTRQYQRHLEQNIMLQQEFKTNDQPKVKVNISIFEDYQIFIIEHVVLSINVNTYA